VRTASVNPFTYFKRMTCDSGTPLPVCDDLFFFERWNPTRAALRANRASFAFMAPIPRKFRAVTSAFDFLVRFAGGKTASSQFFGRTCCCWWWSSSLCLDAGLVAGGAAGDTDLETAAGITSSSFSALSNAVVSFDRRSTALVESLETQREAADLLRIFS